METKSTKMQRVTIRFIRDTRYEEEDDKICIFDTDMYDLFRVTFRAPDMKKTSQFMATRHLVLGYISDILHAMSHDSDPFESIQVDTVIHPSILYHVSEMDEYHIRQLIENTVDSVLFRSIVKTDTE